MSAKPSPPSSRFLCLSLALLVFLFPACTVGGPAARIDAGAPPSGVALSSGMAARGPTPVPPAAVHVEEGFSLETVSSVATADGEHDLVIQVREDGLPVGEGLTFSLVRDASYPNLRAVARRTDPRGQVTLRGLRAPAGLDVPMLAEIGGGKVAFHPNGRRQDGPAPDAGEATAGGYALRTVASVTAANGGHDLAIQVLRDGQPVPAGVTFRFAPSGDFPNLGDRERRTDPGGQVSLRGLMAPSGLSAPMEATFADGLTATYYPQDPQTGEAGSWGAPMAGGHPPRLPAKGGGGG
ncbi:MAG: hypothetical protein LBL95_08315, partial [Deltaproteobacteria bacterium]|nr:hypothetical protein [Deltaproteobacteria bacterium]